MVQSKWIGASAQPDYLPRPERCFWLANRTTLDTSRIVHRWQKHIPSDSPMLHCLHGAAIGEQLMGLSPYYLCREDAARHVREKWGLQCSSKWLAKLAVVVGGP